MRANARSSVDLPQPLGPIMAVKEPSLMLTENPWKQCGRRNQWWHPGREVGQNYEWAYEELPFG